MINRLPLSFYWSALWLVMVSVSLYVRPPLPVDETRYLAVAWEMWIRGDFLVPYLNGETYSHKPPLLFWLMHLGWAVFGVNDLTPRLVAPLFGLGCLFLTRSLARDLWPDEKKMHDIAPLMLLGFGFWALFSTLTMFDLILAFFTLIGLKGAIIAWRGQRIGGFSLLALAIGLGALTKGPAILVHVLPATLLVPVWGKHLANQKPNSERNWGTWYLGVLISLVIGVLIGLAWAIPAGESGGENYRNAILWGQTAGRMVKSFAHQRPFWWYLAVLPGLLLPWIIWPLFWRALCQMKKDLRVDGGLRLCLIWFGIAFVMFSLISGKQLHYLLPEFPAIALALAYGVCKFDMPDNQNLNRWLPGGFTIFIGLVLLLVPVLDVIPRPPVWLPLLNNMWGGAIIAFGGWLIAGYVPSLEQQVARIVLIPVIIVVALYLTAAPALNAVYDLRPFARQLKNWQEQGIPLANFGKYHGQYQFLGRLRRPIAVIGQKNDDVAEFLANNPNGRIIAYYKTLPTEAEPLFVSPFRQMTIAVWSAKTMMAIPNLGDRR